MTKLQKVVVFDLDETLGHFVELGIFWEALENYHKKKLPISKFFETMDIFPEFLRPNIIAILKYLIKQKKKKKCLQVIIYTNNQGERSWTEMISKYFNWKINYKLFDKIVATFKIGNKRIEMCRTSHMKKYTDLLKCTKLPENTQVCFLDDQYHPHMDNNHVFYINSKPYIHELFYHEMAQRYYSKTAMKEDKDVFINNMVTFMNRYNFTPQIKHNRTKKVENIISKRIMQYLKIFFSKEDIPKTRRHPKAKKRRTYKT